jgi:hypothetical protein
MKAKLNPELEYLAEPIDGFIEDPNNARLHPEQNRDVIRWTFLNHGQQKPIVYEVRDGKKVVRVGNCRLAVAKELGWESIAAVPWDGSSDALLETYALGDNRSQERSYFDRTQLRDDFIELLEANLTLTSLGFSIEDQETVLRGWEHSDFDSMGVPEYDPDDERYFIKVENVPLADAARVRALLQPIANAFGYEVAD